MKKTHAPHAGDWDRYWGRDQTEQFTRISWSKRRILKVLEPVIAESSSALDAGCGSGFFAAYFCERGLQTTALDYAEQALALAREKTRGRAAILQKDLLNDDLFEEMDQRFDLIFSDGLLEHFPLKDQRRILTNLMSVLSDRGKIVTFVPNRWSPWELIRPFYMPGIEEDPFVMKDLQALHESNGLIVERSGGVNVLPFALSPDIPLGTYFGMLLYVVTAKA